MPFMNQICLLQMRCNKFKQRKRGSYNGGPWRKRGVPRPLKNGGPWSKKERVRTTHLQPNVSLEVNHQLYPAVFCHLVAILDLTFNHISHNRQWQQLLLHNISIDVLRTAVDCVWGAACVLFS